MSIRPVNVTPLENYCLLVEFDNDEKKVFDVKPYIEGSWYGKLTDESFFRTVPYFRKNGRMG